MGTEIFNLGTRKSLLARTQSDQVRQWLEAAGASCRLVEIESEGDIDRSTPLYALEPGSPGFFTKQLEATLLTSTIDLAVHSLKDLPTLQPPGLKLACVPKREVTGDCLIIRKDRYAPGDDVPLPKGATVGTSSLRREAALLALRPDLNIRSIRGNVPTRLNAVREEKYDAVMLAQAGLVRLGLELEGLVRVDLDTNQFVPAPGQGALGIETRLDCPVVLEKALAKIHDPLAFREVSIERRILRALEGGCSLPLGVRCLAGDGKGPLRLLAFLGLQRDRKHAPRDWVSFHRFDISELAEETLVDKTISYFKGVMHG